MRTIEFDKGTTDEFFLIKAIHDITGDFEVFIYMNNEEEYRNRFGVIRNIYEEKTHVKIFCGKPEDQKKFGIPFAVWMLDKELNKCERNKEIQLSDVYKSIFSWRLSSIRIDHEAKKIYLYANILVK